jgi:hypothetical protein
MSVRVGWLGIVLALQLVLVAALLFVKGGRADADPGPLLTFDANAVTQIALADGEGAAVTLQRDGDGWRLDGGLPADDGKVAELLERLGGLQAAWPVATTASASRRFEVTAETFQRHVQLRAGSETAADLYLGTSPGYQRVHARRADDDAVYSVALANFQVPVGADDWLDKALLQPRGEITALARDGAWNLTRGEEGWLLDAAAADQDEAAGLIRRFAELRVSGAASGDGEGLEERARFRISDADGTFTLTLYGDADGDVYQLRSERLEPVFTLAAYLADQLLVDADRLRANDAAPEPADDGGN